MSCEGNRLKFFEHVQLALGLDAKTLEKVYQAGKSGGADGLDPNRLTEKTRLLFADFQAVGVKPPAHSADGLPRMEARAGYAAVFDYLRRNVRPRTYSGADAKNWPLAVKPDTFLDDHDISGAGFKDHRYVDQGYGLTHIWFGLPEHSGRNSALFLGKPIPDNPEMRRKIERFLRQVDANGNLADGFPPDGFDANGFDSLGYSVHGLTQAQTQDAQTIQEAAARVTSVSVSRNGRVFSRQYDVDIEGFSREDGFHPENADESMDRDRFGFDRRGFRNGRSWTGYDENGLDANGKRAPERKGFDAWGYERKTGLTAPDANGLRRNLIGWVYDPAADECYDPLNPSRRMKHSGSFSYSTKHKKVVLKRSYVPAEADLRARLADPRIRLEEARAGGALMPYGCLPRFEAEALAQLNRPEARYLRSQARLQDEPAAAFLGVPLRCPKCGQFTGAAPHICPQYENRRILAMGNGMVISFERGAYKPKKDDSEDSLPAGFYEEEGDVIHSIFHHIRETIRLPELPGRKSPRYCHGSHLAEKLWGYWEDETAILMEAPHSPLKDYNSEYHGGMYPGYHWKSGLDPEGYDPCGFHYLTGATREGVHYRSLDAMMRLKESVKEADRLLKQKGKQAREVLEVTYSRIATALAGAGRRVSIAEEGGPRPGMFWTDMRGHIQAERYPLQNTPHNTEINNLVAMKAGIYHELGHEEDTSVGIFARVMEIAHGAEEVEGIPRSAAGLVAEIYNILEDGRMERVQSRRRRGVASILAANALVNPRWDEAVGDRIPASHQIMGLMLYRSLPFFHVRQEVLDAAPERVRTLFAEIMPLVDRAMQSPEDAFQSSIVIARKLIEDDDLRRFAERMTQERSQGGAWVFLPGSGDEPDGGTKIIISALPRLGNGTPPDRRIAIPGIDQTEAAQQAGASGNGSGEAQQDGGKSRQAGSNGVSGILTPEMDEDFFRGVSSHIDMDDVLTSLAGEIRQGIHAILHSPVGKALQKPLNAAGDMVLEDPANPQRTHVISILSPGRQKIMKRKDVELLKSAAQMEGRKAARRLETLKEEIQRKARLQTSGALDRKRFKRALAGAETVYRQNRSHDLTSLAVSIQLDMSGSMNGDIRGGRLAGAALALEEALRQLDAECMMSGFGTEYALIKSFGDEHIRDEQIYGMLSRDLGGTVAAPALRLGLLGLKETRSANKLHIVLTDGAFSDTAAAAAQAEEMRRNGILPFGIFLRQNGSFTPGDSLDQVFGGGNWVAIERLADMSGVVARRIEQLYRKILASR